MSHARDYKGPLLYIKKHNQTVARSNPEILSATITLGEQIYTLEENLFRVTAKPDGLVFIYHMYYYRDEAGKRMSGRWYNTQLPLQLLQGLPWDNTFEHTLETYEDETGGQNLGPAIIRVTFAPRAAARLRTAT
jgi:hypothetical protein